MLLPHAHVPELTKLVDEVEVVVYLLNGVFGRELVAALLHQLINSFVLAPNFFLPSRQLLLEVTQQGIDSLRLDCFVTLDLRGYVTEEALKVVTGG